MKIFCNLFPQKSNMKENENEVKINAGHKFRPHKGSYNPEESAVQEDCIDR